MFWSVQISCICQLDLRIYHLVVYSITDTSTSLPSHISGPVHCMTDAGLYNSLLLQSFCLFMNLLLYRLRPTHNKKFDFFPELMDPDLDYRKGFSQCDNWQLVSCLPISNYFILQTYGVIKQMRITRKHKIGLYLSGYKLTSTKDTNTI